MKKGIYIQLFTLFNLSFFLITHRLDAQNKEPIYHQNVDEYNSDHHFRAQYNAAGMVYSFTIYKKRKEQWQEEFLQELKRILGLSLLENSLKGYIPRAEKKASEDAGHFIRESWVIWTEPTVPLPIIVLIPKSKKGPLPLVITPHGHGKSTVQYAGIYADTAEKNFAEKTDRDVAVQAVNEGYIAIAPTTRAFGNTRTEADKEADKSFSCRIQLMHDLLIGRTPIGDRVWDMSKILDWAIHYLPVDSGRIAITGNSGGGTVSLFAAAYDKRIKVAAPSAYFCTFKGSIGSIAHCDCNYIPGILNLGEMWDVAGLIAPRPLSVISGKEDDIFPIEETRRAFIELKKIYNAFGATDKVSLYEGNEGHRYYKNGSWPFIKKIFYSKSVN